MKNKLTGLSTINFIISIRSDSIDLPGGLIDASDFKRTYDASNACASAVALAPIDKRWSVARGRDN